MNVKTIAVRRKIPRRVYREYFRVQVPDGMSDDAVLDTIEDGLKLNGCSIEEDPSWAKCLDVSHEITADGRVKQLVDRLCFGVDDEFYFGVDNQ